MLTRITDTAGGISRVVTSPDELRAALVEMYGTDDAEVTQAIDAYCGADPQAAYEASVYLGLTAAELDPDDPEEVDDELWGRWLCAQLDARGAWVDRDHGVIYSLAKATRDGIWRGGPVQVASIHGSRMTSWIKAAGWGDVRAATEAARAQEAEELAAIAAEKARESARFEAVRAAHRAVLAAEKALEEARAARRVAAREQVQQGDSMYRIAREVGVTQQAVAKWAA